MRVCVYVFVGEGRRSCVSAVNVGLGEKEMQPTQVTGWSLFHVKNHNTLTFLAHSRTLSFYRHFNRVKFLFS